jgi:hypothetical protein
MSVNIIAANLLSSVDILLFPQDSQSELSVE